MIGESVRLITRVWSVFNDEGDLLRGSDSMCSLKSRDIRFGR